MAVDVIDSKVCAAIRIQSIWRGYHARQRHPDVIRVRHEMRSRRSEDHIRSLQQQLTRYHFINDQCSLMSACRCFCRPRIMHSRPTILLPTY